MATSLSLSITDLGSKLWVMAVPDTIILAPAEQHSLTVAGPTPPSTSISGQVINMIIRERMRVRVLREEKTIMLNVLPWKLSKVLKIFEILLETFLPLTKLSICLSQRLDFFHHVSHKLLSPKTGLNSHD